MYSINPLPMNVLITPDEVIRFFPGNSIDPNIFSSVVFQAEQRFVIPILGYNFYQQLCTQKNITVTSGNITTLQTYFTSRNITLQIGCIVNAVELSTMTMVNQLLWNSVLWPFIAECVMFTALPANYAKFTSSGIVKNNPNPTFIDGSASGTSSGISLNDLKYLRDNILLQNISVMTDSLERYLATNITLYPLVPQQICNKWNGDKKQDTRKSGLVFLYDDDEDCYDRRYAAIPAPAPTPVPAPQTRSCTLILKIVSSPDPTHVYLLCNLQTIALEYPVGNTLTVPHLIGKTVNPVIQIDGGMPFVCPFNPSSATFDNTAGGGFNLTPTDNPNGGVIINYNEVI